MLDIRTSFSAEAEGWRGFGSAADPLPGLLTRYKPDEGRSEAVGEPHHTARRWGHIYEHEPLPPLDIGE